jgi:hypothetical protein
VKTGALIGVAALFIVGSAFAVGVGANGKAAPAFLAQTTTTETGQPPPLTDEGPPVTDEAPPDTATPDASVTTVDPEVWVGSPFKGNWPDGSDCTGAYYPSPPNPPPNGNCSLPYAHHTPYNGIPSNAWAADITAKYGAGSSVYLYAAPQKTSLSIKAYVKTVYPACKSLNPADGGYRVTVRFYRGSTYIGSATYAHINPSVTQGRWISRWGTKLGKVGSYKRGLCWQGAHVHIELFSYHNYSCYNKGYSPSYPLNPKNFIGFVGGNRTNAPRKPCP